MTAEARRAHILDVTETLLLEVGNGGLTMRKVATAAGISLGNLQYHFATREDLLLALLLRFLEPYEQRFQQQTKRHAVSVPDALQPMFLELLSLPNFDECATIYKEIWAASSHSPDMRDALNTYYRRLTGFYRKVLASVAAPDTEGFKLDRAAAAMLPILEGYCITKDAIDVPVDAISEDWAQMTAAILR